MISLSLNLTQPFPNPPIQTVILKIRQKVINKVVKSGKKWS